MTTRSGVGAAAVLSVALLLAGCTGDVTGGTATPASTGPTPSPMPTPTSTQTPMPTPTPTEVEPSGPRPTDGTGLPEVVTVTGTVQAGVESGCLLLDGLLLIGGSPEVLQPGSRVTVTGRLDPSLVTFCQQGIPLVVTSVEEA